MRRLPLPILVAILGTSSFLPHATAEEARAENRVLAGTVVGPDGAPVRDAVIRGFYLGRSGPADDPDELASNAAGKFQLERKPTALWLYVTGSNGALAGRAQAEAKDDSVTVKLAPAATVIGRVIENDEPLVGADVVCTLSVQFPPDPAGRVFGREFKAATFTTPNDGRFVFSGLLVGEKHHVPPLPNAAEQLAAALQRAGKEDKRVLLQQSRAGSYPSRLLTRFIADHHQIFERSYVYVNIDSDRAIEGAEVMEPFRKRPGPVPWIAVIRSDGTKLGDSDGPDGNIGFPSEPEAINYFIDKLLKPTAQRVTPEQLEELRQALRGK